jgi:hypothetical protein
MSSDESGDENHVPAHLASQLPPRSPSISSSTFFSLDSDTESEPAHRDTPAQPASRLPLRFPSIDPITFFRLDSDTGSESSDSDTPTQPAPRLPLRFPSFTPDDFFNVDFDAESDPGDLGTRAQPAVVVPEIDDLNAPWHEPLAASDADARHEGKDIWHFLWQNTLYSSAKGFVINTAMAALGGSGTSALAAQAPARAMDATIAAVQTFLSIRRVLNNGMNKKKTYAEASWMEISGEIAFSSATALIGGAIAYFNPSSNVFKRISDVVVGTAEAYRPNLVMKFSPTGEAKATLMSERGHANLTTLLKYAVKRALKEAAFPHALAAPDAEALKGTNPFMMQYIYKSLIDTIVDLFVDVYISLAYKEAAKHVMGIPYQFKDRKPATSEDPFMQRAQKNISKAGIKSGYKIIGSSASDIFTALPNALGTDVPGVPKNVLSIAGALFNGFIAGEVDAHNAHNAAKGESDANVDEQHYENQPSPSTSMERVTVQR